MSEPTKPGRYWARIINVGMQGSVLYGHYEHVDVIDGASIPHSCGERLLVATGLKRPKYRTLRCYDWKEPTAAELRQQAARFAMYANQVQEPQ